MNDAGDLKEGENHPEVFNAFNMIKDYMISNPMDYLRLRESLASCALSGNRTAEVCLSTLERISKGQGVGERYVFGLAWFLNSWITHGVIPDDKNQILKVSTSDYKKGFGVALNMIDKWFKNKKYKRKDIEDMVNTAIVSHKMLVGDNK